MLNNFVAFIFIMTPIWILLGHIGKIIGAPLPLIANIWLLVGAGVCLLLRVRIPKPNGELIDLPGTLKVIWWLVWWPRYLKDRKR